MKKLFIPITLLITLIIFFSSCKKHKEENKGIIPQKEFVEVLTELKKAEGLAIFKRDSTIKQRNIRLREYSREILKKHNITLKDYQKSMKYYSEDEEKLNEIIEQVSNKIKG
ncbi:MAG: DUF4296 domain-containing protein [Bacteroidales bacterium]|jgi:hypothetical protein|nr:DUF4296 domain-containing protein [Bacteroidales bacterium]